MSQQWPDYQGGRSDQHGDPIRAEGQFGAPQGPAGGAPDSQAPTGYGQPQGAMDPYGQANPYGQVDPHGSANPYGQVDPYAPADYGYGYGQASYGQPPAGPVQPYGGAYPDQVFQSGWQVSSRSKVAAALLAFFLGAFGVHNFYLGHTGRGIAQVLITVLSLGMLSPITAIWSLIEFILILTGGLTDVDNRPLRS